MIELGTSSSTSFYNSSITSAYKSNEVNFKHDKKELSDEDTTSTSKNNDIKDTATISNEAKNLYASEKAYGQKDSKTTDQPAPRILGSSQSQDGDKAESADTTKSESKSDETSETKKEDKSKTTEKKSSDELTPEEQQEIAKLKETDMKVKAHEQAHIAAAAGINASAPSYDYQEGPDGQKYAVGGEVNVSFNETGDPEKDKASAETMKRAAMAPADPSSQDRAVARNADKMISEDEKKIQELKEQERAQKDQEKSEKEQKAEENTSNKDINTIQNDSEGSADISDSTDRSKNMTF